MVPQTRLSEVYSLRLFHWYRINRYGQNGTAIWVQENWVHGQNGTRTNGYRMIRYRKIGYMDKMVQGHLGTGQNGTGYKGTR